VTRLLIVDLGLLITMAVSARQLPIRGLTNAAAVARAYDAILGADFANVPARLDDACEPSRVRTGPPLSGETRAAFEVCNVLEAMALWWQISLDPESRVRDAAFARIADRAISGAEHWTKREPERAEAWFYLGAAIGARGQWRVLRHERMAAARDGKQIKETLERSLTLDPALHDANFGIGLYRYYADVAPAAVRMLRWLFLLPGGDRDGGLAQIANARDHGQLVRGEADYQLHLIYLWYEKRAADALELIEGLQARYPGNPLFHQIEAEIHDVYRHDPDASYAASARLLALAAAGQVHDPTLASVQARLNMAVQLDRRGDRAAAIELLETVIADRPARPHGATTRAQALMRSIKLKAES
jgi:tetratricopeptide (TPR) repeat protein